LLIVPFRLPPLPLRIVRFRFLAIGLIAFAASPLHAQGGAAVLDLMISESGNGRPLAGVRVDVIGQRLSDVTDPRGHVRIRRIPAGTQFVRVQRIGYETQSLTLELAAGDTVQLDLTLSSNAIALDTVTATREGPVQALARNGFYDRQKAAGGRFVTRADLDQHPGEPTHSAFQRIRGVSVVTTRNGFQVMGQHGPVSAGTVGCAMRVWLDGMPWRGDLDEIPQETIEAIEVYPSPSEVPAQYGGTNSACGVVLIWTRH
jgi:CarboxypepD_reg-like domain/TonB-dependent Receptor Plug Domain